MSEEYSAKNRLTARILTAVERAGNRLPDPAVLSWLLSYLTFL